MLQLYFEIITKYKLPEIIPYWSAVKSNKLYSVQSYKLIFKFMLVLSMAQISLYTDDLNLVFWKKTKKKGKQKQGKTKIGENQNRGKPKQG